MILKKGNTDDISNIFDRISKEWFLLTAGNKDSYNTMTASWGQMGVLWGKKVATAYVRPERYTYKFMNESDYYTLCFFDEDKRDILKYCGAKSGRNVNKAKECSLTPNFSAAAPFFEEARLVIFCKKEYAQAMNEESFVDKDNLRWYKGDYHNMIFGKIEKILTK